MPTYLLEASDIDKLQRKDEAVTEIKKAISDPRYGSIGLRRKMKNYKVLNNVLYKINTRTDGNEMLLVVPKDMRYEIMHLNHDDPLSGHLGRAKTYGKIRDRYYWDNMQKDVESYVKGCADCQARKGLSHLQPAGPLQPIPLGAPFERIGIDLLGPLRKSKNGNTMIVVATDYATRWVETRALPNGKAESVGKFMVEQLICRHGAPGSYSATEVRCFNLIL